MQSAIPVSLDAHHIYPWHPSRDKEEGYKQSGNGGTQKVGREQISRELRLRPRAEDRAVGIFRSDVKETENRSDAHLPSKREHWTVQRDELLRAHLCQGLV